MPGRNFLFVPGPTNVPERILRAMNRAMEDHRSSAFPELATGLFRDLRKVFKTTMGQAFIFPATGTGGWEAALVNTLSPGDRVLAPRYGQFSHLWIDLAQRHGLRVDIIDVEWGEGAPTDRIGEILAQDQQHEIKGILIVHNETATGVTSDVAAIRSAIDADGGDVARHAGCRLVVDDEDPFDLVLLVLRQDLPDPVGWRALAPLDIDDVHAQAMPLGEIDPQVAELAVPRREHAIARRERVDERRLPPAGAGRGEDERLPHRRLEDLSEIAEQAGGQFRERRGAVVLHRAVHGAEDSLGYVRGAGDEQEIAAGHKKRPQREGKNTASG